MRSEGLPESGDLVDGRYRIQAVIGRGGMGVVFGARDEKESRDVALKLLPRASDGGVQRFLREARILAGLESEHLVRVFGAGTWRGQPYFVMERLRGTELGARLRREGALPLADVADVIVQTCAALAHAHAAGVVHRDVKTSNLFAHDTPDGAIVKVLDFGVARSLAEIDLRLTGTQDAGHLGSTPYMSPEQVKDPRTVDARSDLWALGVVAVRLLTTQFPFGEGPREEVLAAIRTRPSPRVADLGVIVPEPVEEAIAKCLRRDPSARFRDAAELAAAFAPFTSARFRDLDERVRAVVRSAPATTKLVEPATATMTAQPPANETETAFDASTTQADPEAAPAPTRAGARTIGRFVLEDVLGAGGMGEVYSAYDPTLERRVALKLLKKHDVATKKRRVLREARAAAALTHPNTVTIFEVGEADGEVFIAMELLAGRTLKIAAREATTTQKVRWLLEAARALGAAHEQGLVHRDVKPENMFVCRDGTLKLLDFGIAKRDEDTERDGAADGDAPPGSLRTAFGKRIGTPRYMAPEQRAGLATDSRTDQYAWALVAYELLTGEHATDAADTFAGADAPPPSRRTDRLRAAAPELEGNAAAAIARALSPEKDDRFASMAPIVATFEHALSELSSSTGDRAPTAANADLTPPRPSVRTRSRAAAAVVGAALVGVAALVGARFVPTRRPPRPPTLCKVVATHDVTGEVDATDLAVVPDGDGVVFASKFEDQGLDGRPHSLHEENGRLVPWSMFGVEPQAAHIRGARTPIGPVIVFSDLGERGAVTMAKWFAPSEAYAVAHADYVPAGTIDVAALPDRLLVAAAATNTANELNQLAQITVLPFKGSASSARYALFEESASIDMPSLAVAGRHAAVVFKRSEDLVVALLDREGRRFGPPIELRTHADTPAAAWVGDTLVTYFAMRSKKLGRVLEAVALRPDATTLDAPVDVADEPLATARIYTVSPANGGPLLVWPAVVGRRVSIRLSRIAVTKDGPALDAPVEIAATSGLRLFATAATEDGAILAWLDDELRAIRVSRVVCSP